MSAAMKLAWLSCPTDAGCIAAMFSVESGLWSVLLHVAYSICWFHVFYSFLHTSIILFKNKYTLLVPWRNPFKKNIFKGPKRWYPPKKFKFCWFPNQVNIYLGKVTNCRVILIITIWRNSRIPLGGGVESTPIVDRVQLNLFMFSLQYVKLMREQHFCFV